MEDHANKPPKNWKTCECWDCQLRVELLDFAREMEDPDANDDQMIEQMLMDHDEDFHQQINQRPNLEEMCQDLREKIAFRKDLN